LAQRKIIEQLFSATSSGASPMQAWFDAWAQTFSPYDFNPLNINPLRDLLARFVDFEAVRRYEPLALYVCATNVVTGRLRIFPRDKISEEAVMASACLPALFQAVTIDGVPYWDGGYIGNPVIFPLFHGTAGEDVLIVQINPVERREVPTSAHDIADRVTEITFNASLLAEYRAIEFVSRLIDQGRLQRGTGPGQYRRINAHRITLDDGKKNLGADTKYDTYYDFFRMLHARGRLAARVFLDAHYDDIGHRSTFDLAAEAGAEWA
jgi:NTE family protein